MLQYYYIIKLAKGHGVARGNKKKIEKKNLAIRNIYIYTNVLFYYIDNNQMMFFFILKASMKE